jgi:hypothetical protein
VKPNGRKYGNGQSRPIPVWNGILDHRDRIGGAVWEFLWCLDKVSVEKNGVGIVLRGKPVKVEEIVAGISGSDCETVRLHMIALEEQKYIRRRRTPYGHVIEVLNSKKFNIWKPEKPQNPGSPEKEKPQITGRETANYGSRNRKKGGNKEDSAVTQQLTQQEGGSSREACVGGHHQSQTKNDDDGFPRPGAKLTSEKPNRFEVLQDRARDLLVAQGEDRETVKVAIEMLDERAASLRKTPGSAEYYVACFESLKANDEEWSLVSSKVSARKARRDRWMPGFDEKNYSDELDPVLTEAVRVAIERRAARAATV